MFEDGFCSRRGTTTALAIPRVGPEASKPFQAEPNLPRGLASESRAMQLQSLADLFLASAITGVAFLIEIGIFLVLGVI